MSRILARLQPALITMFTAVALTVAGGGCGGRQTPPPHDVIDDPVAVFEGVMTRLEGFQSARIRATVEYYGPEGRVRARQAVLVRTPASLRIETISPFDTTLAAFMVHDGALVFYDVQRQAYLHGAPTPDNLARFVSVWMTAEDLVRVLLGGPPVDAVDADPSLYTVRWNRRAGGYTLTMPIAAGGSLDLDVAHGDFALLGARQRDAAGKLVLDLRAGHFIDVTSSHGPARFPGALRVLSPELDFDLSLEVDRVDVNVELPDALFTLPPPSGAAVQPL